MRFCFFGSGSIGSRHIKNLATVCAHKGISYTIDLVRSTDRPLRDDVADLISGQYFSVDQLQAPYDAIFIANPTYLHRDILQQCKGLAPYFFVEKPLSSDINFDKKELIDLQKNAVYYVACPLRYTKVLMDARCIVRENKVLAARAISSSYLPDWRLGVDYREVYSAHKDQGGGVTIDLIHEWDYVVSLFGMPDKVVLACGRYSDLEIDSEDLAVYLGCYGDKLIEVHLDYIGRCTERSLWLLTPDASYLFDIAHGMVFKNGETLSRYQEDVNQMYLREMDYFVSLVENRASSSSNDLLHAYQVQRISQGADALVVEEG